MSPVNARKQLAAFIGKARKQLWIYDPKINDPGFMHLIEDRAKHGVEVRIIGSIAAHSSNVAASPLSVMRLHTRTIIRDGSHAFVGSQSLRPAELDQRREIGLIIHDEKTVKALSAVFSKDWLATGYDEAKDAVVAQTAVPNVLAIAATKALVKQMPPLRVTLKPAIRQAAKLLFAGAVHSQSAPVDMQPYGDFSEKITAYAKLHQNMPSLRPKRQRKQTVDTRAALERKFARPVSPPARAISSRPWQPGSFAA